MRHWPDNLALRGGFGMFHKVSVQLAFTEVHATISIKDFHLLTSKTSTLSELSNEFLKPTPEQQRVANKE